MQTVINARKIHFSLGSNDVGDVELSGKIEAFALKRHIDNVLITTDGHLLLDSAKKIMLNSGVRTIKAALELKDLPTRVTTPLPSSFLLHYFANGYDEQRIVYSRGPRFEREAIETNLKDKRELARYRCNDQQTAKPKQMLIEPVNIGSARSDLKCDLELGDCYEASFTEWRRDPETSTYRVANPECEPYRISIESRKGNLDQKQKHYWIYSHRANFGKSCFVREFVAKYNAHRVWYHAHRVSDTNRWVGVSESAAQFLVFQYYEGDHKLSWSSLMSLTGSTASSGGDARVNRKSYGHSYQPRDDVQVVILSNESPFETYGKYDAKTTRRYIGMDVLSQLEERFNIHRLDGPLEEDRIKFMEPSNWTDKQFAAQLGRVFESLRNKDIVCLSTRQVIPSVFALIRQAKQLLHARYQVSDRGETTRDLFAVRLDALPIFLPSLKTSLGDIARALYTSEDRKKTGMSWEASLERLIEDEDALRDRLRSSCLEDFIETKQYRLIKDAAYIRYVKANRRYFYDGVFDVTFVPGDVDWKDMYSPDVLREMLDEFDSHIGPELFATRQIYEFVKVVLEEFFNADQSRVTEIGDAHPAGLVLLFAIGE